MNGSLFQNHPHLTSSQYYPYQGYNNIQNLMPLAIPHSYPQTPVYYYQPLQPASCQLITNERLSIILIAILFLVSLDLIFVRPSKKTY